MELIITSKEVDHIILFDKEDLPLIDQYHWCLDGDGYVIGYRKDTPNPRGSKKKWIKMHRLVMKDKITYKDFIDHENQVKTDCQKHNLRIATKRQNNTNIKPRGESGYLGVHKGSNGKWQVKISFNKNLMYFGSFEDKIDAAKKYDEVAKIYHGEFANLNFKSTSIDSQIFEPTNPR